MKKENETTNNSKPMAYDTLLGVVHWDVDIIDFELPSNMVFTTGSEFDDTSIEAFRKEQDGIRWVIFRVDSTWYVMEQYEAETRWVESWTKQLNKHIADAKIYAEQQAWAHYA